MEVTTLAQLSKMTGTKPNANMRSMHMALEEYGPMVGLDRAHRLAQFLPQVMHESGNFKYDREIWGPTPAQARYDTRTDLGNTPAKDGDGEKNAGRGPIQLTGADNIARFYLWCVNKGLNPPDFRKDPNLINTDPWEGLSAIWYWDTGNPTGKSLNRYADEGNNEQITKKINGGLNGYDDRLSKFTRVALVLLGYEPLEVKRFQKWAQQNGYLPKDEPGKPPQVDGDDGPKTRSALHMALVQMDGLRSTQSAAVKAAPVVEETTVEVPVPVAVTGGAEKSGGVLTAGLVGFVTTNAGSFFSTDLTTKLIILGVSALALGYLMWRGPAIAKRIKETIAAFN